MSVINNKQLKLLYLIIPFALSACSANIKYKAVNDSVSEENRVHTLVTDKGSCAQKAYEVIKYTSPPRPSNSNNRETSTSYIYRDENGRKIGSVTPERQVQRNYSALEEGFNEARRKREVRKNSYGNRIQRYETACLKAKGWRLEAIEKPKE